MATFAGRLLRLTGEHQRISVLRWGRARAAPPMFHAEGEGGPDGQEHLRVEFVRRYPAPSEALSALE